MAAPPETTYGVKMAALVDGVTSHIRDLLRSKIEKWCIRHESKFDDFVALVKPTIRIPEQIRMIQSMDIRKWDASLCDFVLKRFLYYELNETESIGLKELISLRNKYAHAHSYEEVSEEDFNNACETAPSSLLKINAPYGAIQELIQSAKEKVSTTERQLSEMEESKLNFDVIDVLGHGRFAIVLRAKNKVDQKEYALKLIPDKQISEDAHQKVLREAQNYANLEHSNVVKYQTSEFFKLLPDSFESILNKANALELNIYFIEFALSRAKVSKKFVTGLLIQTEVCGENLRDWLERAMKENSWDQEVALKICTDVGKGIKYMHTKGYSHRDIRPENLYFSSTGFKFPVKIGDFGFCNQLQSDEAQTATRGAEVGHELYRAYEMDEPHPDPSKSHLAKYSGKVDLWSYGLVIAEVFDPVPKNRLKQKFDKIIHAREVGDRINSLSLRINQLVLNFTNLKPEDRILLPDETEMEALFRAMD